MYLHIVQEPPTNVRVTVTAPHSVVVTWNQSRTSGTTGYLVVYQTTTSYASAGRLMVTGRSTTSVNLSDLEENTPYNITVQSNSSGILSAPSDVVSVKTLSDGK